jgi:hypothetical protein
MNESRREKIIRLYKNAPEAIQKLLRLDEVITKSYDTAKEIVGKWGDAGYIDVDNSDETESYICFHFPNLSHSDIKKLSRTIDENSIAEIRRKTRTIHFLVIFWSIVFALLLFAIGVVVLRFIDTYQPQLEQMIENLEQMQSFRRW